MTLKFVNRLKLLSFIQEIRQIKPYDTPTTREKQKDIFYDALTY